ncbi:MAG: response regulator transcription factor [Rubrivivax sp.]|nr:response regulator transcription factor [Rubrivivax sp.]
MKLLLVDDHALFRDGLALLVGLEFPALELLQAGSLAQAQELLARHPDTRLVLLDLGLPDAAGLAALSLLRQVSDLAPCVILSAEESPAVVLAALDAGAAGFIPKTTQSDTMLAALRTILAGGVYLPPCVTGELRPPAPGGEAVTGLSERQMDVLRLLLEGKSNKHIGRELGLSESTVKTHLSAIFRRLDVNSRTQAVVAASRLGLRLAFMG